MKQSVLHERDGNITIFYAGACPVEQVDVPNLLTKYHVNAKVFRVYVLDGTYYTGSITLQEKT